jgi:hypothetical protein
MQPKTEATISHDVISRFATGGTLFSTKRYERR